MSLWSFVISSNLFYCSDSVPFLDFIPPFVHGSQFGDFFIVNPNIVYVLWLLLIFLIFIVPYYLVVRVNLKKKKKGKINKKNKI